MKYSVNQILKLKEGLTTLPEATIDRKEFLNRSEALALLADTFVALNAKGYSPEMLAKLLSEGGFQISTSTLRRRLKVIESSPPGGTRRKKQNTATPGPQPSAKSKSETSLLPTDSPRAAESASSGFMVRPDTKNI